jgi:O-antigen/teichoic acid export membrane protein
MEESRTQKTIRNVRVALIYYVANLALNFFSRKAFIDHLGAEVLGLNATVTNLLSFLNLAELGIGGAVSFLLYTPLFEKDRKTISEIVSVQGWLYRRIATIILAGGLVLMCFFPLIFAKAQVPTWFPYATFLVMLFSALLGYFVNYRQIVLTADQKDYKITINTKTLTLVKVLLEILAITFLPHGYMWWVLLEFIFTILIAYSLDRLIKREYPWLKTRVKEGDRLRKQYPQILTKTKQLFYHQIAGFALNQTSPLIIYGFASLTLVAIYQNYMLIVLGVISLVNALLNSLQAGIGNLVAEGKVKKTMDFYWQIGSFRNWIASVCCVLVYLWSAPFVTMWIGAQYKLPTIPLLLVVAYLFIILTRISDTFINAYGIYQDVYAPMIEAVLNIGSSILLGHYFGLNGILSGVLFSLLIIVEGWKPYFLFTRAFRQPPLHYFLRKAKYLLFIFAAIFVVYLTAKYLLSDWGLLSLALQSVVYIALSLAFFLGFDKNMRQMAQRLARIVRKVK